MLKAKSKTSSKIMISHKDQIKDKVLSVLKKASDMVGSTLGPGGKVVLIESDYDAIPHTVTKDGVTVLKNMGFSDSVSHVIIESIRESALKTASIAGDGTTTTTILAYALTKNIFKACDENPKLSPQKITRQLIKDVYSVLIPFIESKAIKIDPANLNILRQVILTSANGEEELADAVMQVFEKLAFSPSSHVTIKQQTGKRGYEVGLIEGYPISSGMEDSVGRFFNLFLTDTATQKGIYDLPKFLLYDGQISDLAQVQSITEGVSRLYNDGHSEYKNLVIIANGFSEHIINALSYNISDPNTINVIPIKVPMAPIMNSQTHLLYDMAHYLNTKVYGIKEHISIEEVQNLGKAECLEVGRFKTTIIGNPDPTNIEIRAEELLQQLKNTESVAEKWWLEERLGKLTGGIGIITIFGGNGGELKEMHDRCEDAILAAKSALKDGALYGGGRILVDSIAFLTDMFTNNKLNFISYEILSNALREPLNKLYENAGYNPEEIEYLISEMAKDPNLLYDLFAGSLKNVKESGVYDSLPALKEAITNAVSIASVFGTMSGIIVYPRDRELDKDSALQEENLKNLINNAEEITNINDNRI